MSLDEVRAELDRLTRELNACGLTVDEFKTLGDNWKLDALDRGLLTRIRHLEFLAGVHPSPSFNETEHEPGVNE
ncbi:hypothetical protein [Nocardia africana]